jgi:hypothetical protein
MDLLTYRFPSFAGNPHFPFRDDESLWKHLGCVLSRRNKVDNRKIVAISSDSTNSSFYISNVEEEVMTIICSSVTCASDVHNGDNVDIILIGFPHNVYLYSKDERHIPLEEKATTPSIHKFPQIETLVWNDAFTNMIYFRKNYIEQYKIYTKHLGLPTLCRELGDRRKETLRENEELKKEIQELKQQNSNLRKSLSDEIIKMELVKLKTEKSEKSEKKNNKKYKEMYSTILQTYIQEIEKNLVSNCMIEDYVCVLEKDLETRSDNLKTESDNIKIKELCRLLYEQLLYYSSQPYMCNKQSTLNIDFILCNGRAAMNIIRCIQVTFPNMTQLEIFEQVAIHNSTRVTFDPELRHMIFALTI